MPFKSKKQQRACYATKGFGGKVDCDEWSKKTNFKKLPEKKNFSEWMKERLKQENKQLSEMVNESTTNTRYSIGLNFRSTKDEVVESFAKIILGYVSAAIKQNDYHVKHVFDSKPVRIIVTARNWDDGSWSTVVSFNPQKECFIISKGFYDKARKTVSIQSSQECSGNSAAEITKELRNIMHQLKDKKDNHEPKLKPVGLKRGPK